MNLCALPGCDKPARSNNPNSTCCDEHKYKLRNIKNAHPLPSKTCAYCGEIFYPRNIVARACNKIDCQTARKTEWKAKNVKPAVPSEKPKYCKESTLAGTGIKPVRRSAHVVSREQWKMDVLRQAAMLPDYNPHRPEVYIERILARQGG